MATTKEWRCAAHGPFESAFAKCPAGCVGTVTREFRTPPAFRTARTSNIDATLEHLAANHGMTDISNRGGVAAKRETGRQIAERQDLAAMIRERYGDGWGKIPKGGNYNVGTGKVEGSGPGVAGALSTYHGHADNALAEVKPALVPKPVRIIKDHENLTLDMVKT